MYAIEFETIIQDNTVHLPVTSVQSLTGKVKVILLKEESRVAPPSFANAISEIRGKYKDKLPDSETFARRKADEMALEERKWTTSMCHRCLCLDCLPSR